jgi:peptide/nickel transport system permease protein
LEKSNLTHYCTRYRPLGVVTQLMRNSLLEVLQQDYIRTARAKGLSNFKIIYKHALKNALNPVVTAISGWFASMLAGAVFIEYIFGWNGLGKEIVEALNNLDLPVVMGAVLVISFVFVIITILVDFIYAYLDPKIKL